MLSRPQSHNAAGRIKSIEEKNPVISSGIESATFHFVAHCLNQLRYGVPPSLFRSTTKSCKLGTRQYLYRQTIDAYRQHIESVLSTGSFCVWNWRQKETSARIETTLLLERNKSFWKELIVYFPFTTNGVFHTTVWEAAVLLLLMGWIHEASRWDWLRYHDIYTVTCRVTVK
jgi:hypothetical protein